MTRSCSSWLSSELILLFKIILLSTLIKGTDCDPANLVLNGDFEKELFTFGVFPQQDVIHDGEMSYIPFFKVVYGGVQILDATEYLPDPEYAGSFLIHMNYWYGPGVLHSVPLVTPRKGATYNLSFDMADNPDGGPLYKALRVKILVNNEDADPVIMPFNVSSPQAQRNTIVWVNLGATFVGTGESTTLQFESLVPGSFGPLIDNIKVTLLSLVDNGSFEVTSEEIEQTNSTFYTVLEAPSDIITSWTVTNGKIKRAGDDRWQASTDESTFMLDMNAELTAGTIVSDAFPTRPGFDYTVLFDATANPEPSPPLKGVLFGAVISQPSASIVASASVIVNADSFTQASLGWQTHVLTFTALENAAVVEFMSRIPGSDGPFLDNVVAYQVLPTGDYKSVGLTYGTAGTALTPSIMWIAVLAGALVIFLRMVY